MQRKRKAHFLSRFFLAGFTLAGDQSGFLHVHSKKQSRSWRAKAGEAGHQRDLFSPEGASFSPNDFEDAFAAVEGEIAPVLRKVITTETLPVGSDRDILLHLLALNASRPPGEMASLTDALDLHLRRMLAGQITPEVHQRVLDDWRNRGRDTADVEDLEALRARIRGGGIRAVFDRDYFLVAGVLGRAAMLVDLLAARSWSLLLAPEGLDFVCSDRPVSLLNNRNLPPGVQPRFDDPRFDVIMPLSRGVGIVGHYYNPGQVVRASPRTLGFVNHVTESAADDYVYSPRQTYTASRTSEFAAENTDAYRTDLGVRGWSRPL
jgi:hypothetical protein